MLYPRLTCTHSSVHALGGRRALSLGASWGWRHGTLAFSGIRLMPLCDRAHPCSSRTLQVEDTLLKRAFWLELPRMAL